MNKAIVICYKSFSCRLYEQRRGVVASLLAVHSVVFTTTSMLSHLHFVISINTSFIYISGICLELTYFDGFHSTLRSVNSIPPNVTALNKYKNIRHCNITVECDIIYTYLISSTKTVHCWSEASLNPQRWLHDETLL